jgi:hypothetical protein
MFAVDVVFSDKFIEDFKTVNVSCAKITKLRIPTNLSGYKQLWLTIKAWILFRENNGCFL